MVSLHASTAVSAASTTANYITLAIFKNGVNIAQNTGYPNATNATMNVTVSCDDMASGTDYYEVDVYVTTASGTATTNGAADVTYFEGFVVGAGPIGPTGPSGGPTGNTGPTGSSIGVTGGVSASPTATTSTTGVMMGLGTAAGFFYTPKNTGNLSVWVAGTARTATASAAVLIFGKFGTGTAPANAAAPSGTTFGLSQTVSGTVALGAGFMVMGRITGLALNTAVWIDLDISTASALDAASVVDVQCMILEL
jgi:hypothetical protein